MDCFAPLAMTMSGAKAASSNVGFRLSGPSCSFSAQVCFVPNGFFSPARCQLCQFQTEAVHLLGLMQTRAWSGSTSIERRRQREFCELIDLP
jgi:hypothetical protein